MAQASYIRKNLYVCHVNAQSLCAHLDEFRHYFSGARYHIIGVSETWLRPEITDDMVELQGYTLLRNDRRDRVGRGVAIYILDSLRGTLVDCSENEVQGRLEFIMVDIQVVGASRLLLAIVYRPPHAGYLGDFEEVFMTRSIRFL